MSMTAIAAAAQMFVAVNGISHHFDPPPEGFRPADYWNETNTGLGLEFRTDNWVGMIGGLEDSNYREMYYFAVGPRFAITENLSFDIPVGVMNRVMFKGPEATPYRTEVFAALPRISYDIGPLSVAGYYTPKVPEHPSSDAIFVQFLIGF